MLIAVLGDKSPFEVLHMIKSTCEPLFPLLCINIEKTQIKASTKGSPQHSFGITYGQKAYKVLDHRISET